MTLGRLTSVLFACLVALGTLRPSLPELLRDHWPQLIVAFAVGAATTELFRARTHERPFEVYLYALLAFVLAALYLQPQRVASDGIFYFAPLHSVVVDFDLDFENEYRVLGAERGYFQRTETGRLPNNYSIGPAILWTPFYLIAHALAHVGLYRPTGFGYPYFTAVATATALAGFVGVVCLFRLLGAYYRKPVAFVVTVLVWLASFHVWYMVYEPSMSHAMAMASVALFFLWTHDGVHGTRAFAVMGLLGGIVALMRWQNVVFLPVALVVSWARYGKPRPAQLLAGGATFLLVFSPQLLYWKAIYGNYVLVPQGGGYIDWSNPELSAVLFSARHGLLSWAPILWLGVLGFPGFVRRAPAFGVGLAAATAAAWYVNASVYDWWAGASFGSRRFDAALPAFALGMGVSIGWISTWVQRRPLATTLVLLVPFIVWNTALMGVYFSGAIPPDGPHSWRQAASDAVELAYRRTGYPPAWPASTAEALRTGRPLSAYDLSGSLVTSHNVDIRMGDNDALHLGRGWSLPHRRARRTFRTVRRPHAEVYVALIEKAPYTLRIEGLVGGKAALTLNASPLPPLVLQKTGYVEIPVPSKLVVPGINRLVLLPEGRTALLVSRLLWLRPGEIVEDP